MRHRRTRWGRIAAALVTLTLLAPVTGALPKPPVLPELRDAATRPPLVLVPGIGGTKLRERSTGRVLWGNARSLFFPRDGGYRMALPLEPGGEGENVLEPFAPVLQIRLLGLLKKEAYAPIQRLLEANGYRTGRLQEPRPDDTFFFLDYDWRKSVVDAAGELGGRLAALRSLRGADPLEVDLVCQSTAGLVCRWFAKYGTAGLEQAVTGGPRPVAGVRVRKLVLLGTAGDGSIDVLKELADGRRYLYGVGRRWRQETLFTFPSLFESLPGHGDALFVDEQGRPLDVDLYDPDNWIRYGWSVFSATVQRRLARPALAERFGDEARRRSHLERMLARARRLRGLLDVDPAGYVPPHLYSLQGAYQRTPARAVLFDDAGSRDASTGYAGEGVTRRDPWLRTLVFEPGDGHASHASQEGLSAAERKALAHPPELIGGTHFEFVLDAATWRLLLRYLAE